MDTLHFRIVPGSPSLVSPVQNLRSKMREIILLYNSPILNITIRQTLDKNITINLKSCELLTLDRMGFEVWESCWNLLLLETEPDLCLDG